ncbi:MAG TPA: glycoside hydrolase family 76 protein [Solirubrobacteraceae bacterium]
MTRRLDHIPQVRARPAFAAAVGTLALLCAGAPPGLAAHHAARHAGVEGVGSRYPSGAEYPRKQARASEFAHASANTGGASAGGKATTKTRARPKKPKRKPGLHGNPARALMAYAAMQQNFYVPGSGLYAGEPYSYLWPFSQALVATVGVSGIHGQAAKAAVTYARELHVRMYGLGKYWNSATSAGEPLPGEQPEAEGGSEGGEASETVGVPPPTLPSYNGGVVPPGGVSYYDDNEWVGIELVRLYKRHHEAPLLEKAEQIMAFVMSGWQTNPKLACVGGVPFSNSPSNTDRNTITNAPAAELGVGLYKLTGNQTYLQFAQTAYEWTRTCLLQPNGLYADHIRQHGVIDPTLWSYTQGAMIGAGTLLYQATGNSTYLSEARQTASAAQAYFTVQRLLGENPFFPSVYLRNLMYLDSLTHESYGGQLAQSYVNYMWVNRRLKSGLFVFGSPLSSQLLVQAAVVQIYSLLSTSPSTYF